MAWRLPVARPVFARAALLALALFCFPWTQHTPAQDVYSAEEEAPTADTEFEQALSNTQDPEYFPGEEPQAPAEEPQAEPPTVEMQEPKPAELEFGEPPPDSSPESTADSSPDPSEEIAPQTAAQEKQDAEKEEPATEPEPLENKPPAAVETADIPSEAPASDAATVGQPIGIIARPFEVRVASISDSRRVYLFNVTSGEMTKSGKIVLMRSQPDGRNAMAFRVLRTYPETQEFAATRVREYAGFETLPSGQLFTAIEKVGDKFAQPTAMEAQQDADDLAEIEDTRDVRDLPPEDASGETQRQTEGDSGEPLEQDPELDSTAEGEPSGDSQTLAQVLDYDPELDAGITPPPFGSIDTDAEDTELAAQDDLRSIAIEDIRQLDTDRQWLSAQIGFLKNQSFNGGASYYSGIGFRYALNVGKMMFLYGKRVQDSLSAEGGWFLYKILGYEVTQDAYTVSPFVGTLRYNILFGEDFSLFFYGGLMGNFVVSSFQASEEGQNRLRTFVPAFGTGMTFRIGPRWQVRADFGLDMIATGLVLRF